MGVSVWLCFLVILKVTYGQYEVPPPTLEAFYPAGLRVTVRADPLSEMFAFHGKVNKEFKQMEPGDFSQDIKKPSNGFYVYDNPDLPLKVGDEINYWIFVQHDGLGYRLDNRKFKVTELKSRNQVSQCSSNSVSVVSGSVNVCPGTVVLQDEFTGDSISDTNWIHEQYQPEDPDYEFVVYTKDGTVTYEQNNHLVIKPKLKEETALYENLLDLSEGCTKENSKRFKCSNKVHILQNPVISGRLTSQKSFKYADVEIKAKLPAGDWMYPEIYLEDKAYNRLVIAYARGNKVLKGKDNLNIGGPLLFGGPMISPQEPMRSEKLLTYNHASGPLSDDFHVYRLKWTPEQIELFIDGNRYGSMSGDVFPNDSHLVIGVGVGGINDFPNDYMSGDIPKPWKNTNKFQVKTFYESRNQWLPSWSSGGTLQVEYVKITSI